MSAQPELDGLAPELRARLQQGDHERVAGELAAAGEHRRAAAVLEQIWDFVGAAAQWRAAGEPVRALDAALQSETPLAIDAAIAAFESVDDAATLRAAAARLTRRKRHHDAARLLARASDEPHGRAQALLRGGDRTGAARVWADAGQPLSALRALGELGDAATDARAHALAAELCWDLGDAEAAARHAQAALRHRPDDEACLALLARALTSLGHELAAELVLPPERHVVRALPGRYRVTGTADSALVGAAYVGVDRTSLQEVEIHLLLADVPEQGPLDPEIGAALQRFAAVARAAASIGHPAIRPILELREDVGLLVLPRAAGPTLRTLVRPPGMAQMRPRARALVAFLIEGLLAAHARGLVHGALLPSNIAADALGRPTLGPFGAHHLQGLAATHTGALDELLSCTPPEVRAGAAPSSAADRYAVGALLAALLRGRLGPLELDEAASLPELELAAALCDPQPSRRPELDVALAMLSRPVPHVRELEARASASESVTAPQPSAGFDDAITLEVAASWPDDTLDRLCAASSPWWQPILDRRGRQVVLAAWPAGCRGLPPDTAIPDDGLPPGAPADALALPEPVGPALRSRVRAGSWVINPAGQWLLALDDVLSR